MIYSYELEQHVLAGLLRHPDLYPQVCAMVSEKDFHTDSSVVNQTIFKVIRFALENGEAIDEVVIAQRIKELNISFEDNINPIDYIKSLGMRKITTDGLLTAIKDLKKITIRREIDLSAQDVSKKMRSLSGSHSFDDIISEADNIYNKQVDFYSISSSVPENIYEDMEYMVEERGNNPQSEFGPMGPHHRVNELYGSLLRPGNISVIVARSGVGKTTFCLDFATKASKLNKNIPVLHFDNGEMSKEEIVMRQCAALSGVNLSLIETGQWRRNAECVEKVRAIWPTLKELKFYYYNVAGMDIPSMLNIAKRFYYSTAGRNNPMILSFDYIKTTRGTLEKGQNEWQIVGNMVTSFKDLIQKEILGEDGPVISMITSVQSNRSGITTNRRVENVLDDESIVSLSDRIIQFCSHMFHLRAKTNDELHAENGLFGTHVLSCFKYRHLGKDFSRALNLVEQEDGSKARNHINLKINNFNIEEIGDLQDQVDSMALGESPTEDGDNTDVDL